MLAKQTSVLLGLSSGSAREYLRAILAADPGIIVVADAETGSEAIAQARKYNVDTIVCDAHVIGDPHLEAMFARHPWQLSCGVVLMSARTKSTHYHGPIPLLDTLQLDLPAQELGPRIIAALKGHALVKPAGRTDRGVPHRDRDELTMGPPHFAAINVHVPAPTSAPDRKTGDTYDEQQDQRRRNTGEHSLEAKFWSLQQDQTVARDRVTGLPDSTVLGPALDLLPEANRPVAVVALSVWLPRATADGKADEIALMRSLSTQLRVNVRHDDLVLLIRHMTFAILLPDVEPATATKPIRRLQSAVARLNNQEQGHDEPLGVAIGVGFWSPDLPGAAPFGRAWNDMVLERRAAGHS